MKEKNTKENYPKGWVCPKCGRVYNPNVISCPKCREKKKMPWEKNEYWEIHLWKNDGKEEIKSILGGKNER